MLDLSPEKIFVVAIVALVVLGPQRLPQAARTLGRVIGQLRAMASSAQEEVRSALHEPEQAFGAALADFRPADIRRSLRQGVIDTLNPPSPAAGPARTDIPAPGPLPGMPPTPAAGSPARSGHPDDPSLN